MAPAHAGRLSKAPRGFREVAAFEDRAHARGAELDMGVEHVASGERELQLPRYAPGDTPGKLRIGGNGGRRQLPNVAREQVELHLFPDVHLGTQRGRGPRV